MISDTLPSDVSFIEPLAVATQKTYYKEWEKALKLWIRQNRPLEVSSVPQLKQYSHVGEKPSQFRQRITLNIHEARDAEIEKLRQQMNKKLQALETKLQRAELKVEKEESQASGKMMDTLISAGTMLFSAFLGRKTVSATNARRLGSTIRKAKGAMSERGDIALAQQQVSDIQADIDELSQQFEQAQQKIAKQYDVNNIMIGTAILF